MKYFEEINNEKNILITKIFEPNENSLEFELAIGQVSEFVEDIIINEKIISSAHRIQFDKDSIQFKVFFETYICYSVINESYESLGGNKFDGNKIRIYSDSNFLSYLKADTFATPDYPGEFKHYAFISQNHIINIASLQEPNIEKLK
jgi:hypothetical protein